MSEEPQQLRMFDETLLPEAAAGLVPTGDSCPPVRPVHYLGSKLSLLGPIEQAIGKICPPDGTVCDLFSGSATVAARLGRRWPVVAVDVQEYTRVLASALLLGPGEVLLQRLLQETLGGGPGRIDEAIAALAHHEKAAIQAAVAGNPDALVTVLEAGSFEAFSRDGQEVPASIHPLYADLAAALTQASPQERKRTVVTRYFGGLYFAWEQAAQLDALLSKAHSLSSPSR